ncbi:MAG TPA: PDZ domain-containing protein, partial [Anaerolineae bacterium]|nr:PDZ domain-containing protein [Anaerolineae bacterium]
MSSQDRTRMALVIVLVLAIVVAAGGTGFAAGWFLSPRIPLAPAASASQADLQQRFQLFWEAWSVIDREFNRDGPIDLQKAVYGAISGAVQSLGDPYTAFSPPAQAKILAQDLEGCFEGIGATVDLVDGLLTVVQPLEGSPAFKAGLLSNDVVLEVDGTPLKGMDLTQAIALIRGPKGSQVRLLIRREGMAEPFEVVLTRERIDLPTVSYHMLDDGIAYVRLAEFNSQATVRLQAALGDYWPTAELILSDDVPADYVFGAASSALVAALERDFGPDAAIPEAVTIIVIEPDGTAHLLYEGL